jgi:hypothetical protein
MMPHLRVFPAELGVRRREAAHARAPNRQKSRCSHGKVPKLPRMLQHRPYGYLQATGSASHLTGGAVENFGSERGGI